MQHGDPTTAPIYWIVNYASVHVSAQQHVAAGADHERTDIVSLRLQLEGAP